MAEVSLGRRPSRPPQRKLPGNRMRARLQQARMMQQRAQAQQVAMWMTQFDVNGSGKLERDELAALLLHLHPEAGWPDSRALDLLITQATELNTYSLQLKGNPNGAVGRDMLMPVVSGYAMCVPPSLAVSGAAAYHSWPPQVPLGLRRL